MGNDIIKGKQEGGSSISAADCLEKYRAYLTVERGLIPGSIVLYMNDLKALLNFLDSKNITLDELDINTLKVYIESVQGTSRTINRKIAAFNSFFNFLYLEKIINDPLFLSHVENEKITPKDYIVNDEDIERIIKAVPQYKLSGIQVVTMILLCRDCGCYIHELLNFQLSDIDNNVLLFNNHKFQLSDISLEYLTNYINNFRCHIKIAPGLDNFLFVSQKGKKIAETTAINLISKAIRDANSQVSLKAIRYTCIYREYKRGVALAELKRMFSLKTASVLCRILTMDK